MENGTAENKNLKIYEIEEGQIIIGEGLTAIKIGEN